MSKDMIQETIQLAEDAVSATKRAGVSARVKINTITDVAEHLVESSLTRETVAVERASIGRVIEAGEAVPVATTIGDVTIIPIFEEVAVVEKRLRLKEELRLTRIQTDESVRIPVSLRKQRQLSNTSTVRVKTSLRHQRDQVMSNRVI